MAKRRITHDPHQFVNTAADRRRLQLAVQLALPTNAHVLARNFARSSASSYWLLMLTQPNHATPRFLTLRIADHLLWLTNHDQLAISWESGNFTAVQQTLHRQLTPETLQRYSYQFTTTDIITLRLILHLEQYQLIWLIQLAPEIAKAYKNQHLDLRDDFGQAKLLLGNMNNSSLQLVPVKQPAFQNRLSQYFGRNLLFSQFTSHHLLRLLPTNQWIRPLLKVLPPTPNLEQQLSTLYGTDFVRIYVEAIRQQARLQAISS
ncbi:hypothetical protein BB562_01190 [Lactiplantibacillus pentosus]|uniref:hypothetical protein n=1 Tax=Lactiplantibacillus pentosus TaxID=1589 RepID=UPI000C7C335E|nr:hypothetical protein [Lactiplantibacillus pentosus]AUI77403.1 hypothetical protein BB562_01190 [Lactiplantibacillus pentosus]MCE6029309.1 hypothetical protein [Lactiplantibacillus pentosus]MCT3276894.1 hypothetical protein [Lactiplantibacillus pentosus]